jgi:hypothetical protein
MDKTAREKLLRENREAQAELQRDMEARRQQRLNDISADPQPQRRVMNHGENIVRKSVQPQRGDSDAAFNAWFAKSFEAHFKPYGKVVAKHFNRLAGEVRKSNERISATSKNNAEWIARKDREFSAELAIVRDAMLRQNSENLTAMRKDLLRILKKDIVDEVMKINKAMSINANVTDIHGKRKA